MVRNLIYVLLSQVGWHFFVGRNEVSPNCHTQLQQCSHCLSGQFNPCQIALCCHTLRVLIFEGSGFIVFIYLFILNLFLPDYHVWHCPLILDFQFLPFSSASVITDIALSYMSFATDKNVSFIMIQQQTTKRCNAIQSEILRYSFVVFSADQMTCRRWLT